MNKKVVEVSKKKRSHIRVVKNLPNYDNDPFLVKKYEEALKAFDNAPMPDFIAKKIIKPE